MFCKIKISSGNGKIYDWSDDCNELVDLIVQLLPGEKVLRCHETTQLRAFNISKFLRNYGVEVQMEIENPSEHARLTVWEQRLRSQRNDITVEQVETFIKMIGINYRELQIRGLQKLLQSYFAILAAICGAGKTLLNLSVAQFRKMSSGKVLVFVIAPSSCAQEYVKEIERFRGYFDLTMLDTCGLSAKKAKEKILECECDIVLLSVDSINN